MISSLFLGLLGLLYIYMTLQIINARHKYKVSLGVGQNKEIESLVSAHSNFSNYVPILMILLFAIELISEAPNFIVYLLGTLIFLGRLLHFIAFKDKMNFTLRKYGMHLTIWPLVAMSTALIVYSLYRLVSQ